MNLVRRCLRIKNLSCLAAGFVCFLASPLRAAPDPALTFDDCVRELIAANPELKSGRYTVQASQLLEQSQKGAFYPQLSANVSGSRGSGGGFGSNFGGNSGSGSTINGRAGTTTTTTQTGINNTASQSLSLTQNIFSGFQTDAKVHQAEATTAVNSAALAITKARLSYDLKSAFALLLYSQNFLKLTQDIIKRREENLKIVELRYQGGSENKGSFLLSKASLEQAKFDSLQAKNSISVSQEQLAKAIGRQSGSDLEIRGMIPLAPPEPNVDYNKIVLTTPEDLQAVAKRKLAESDIEAARSQYYPTINLTSDVGRQETSSSSDRNKWDVGLNLSFPLFTGGKDYYAVESATVSALAASSDRENVIKQVLVKLKQTNTGYVEAVEKVKVDKSFVDAASTRAEIARSKYNNGLLSFEDWDIIENDLITRQKSLLQTERDRIIAEAAWEQSQGKGVLP